jgi:membrane peptidoglycan carboxypeptidase
LLVSFGARRSWRGVVSRLLPAAGDLGAWILMIGAGVRSGVLLKLFGLCVLAGVLVASLMMPLAAGFGATVNRTATAMSNMSTSLANKDMPQVSTITDKDGAPIAYLFDDYRVDTPSSQISDTTKAAITAVEDKRFWDHGGVDWQGTMRAFATNLTSGSTAQGASTITQQYVKNYLVHVVAQTEAQAERAKETTVARKLREARVAVELERTMTKDEILAGYLNVVPFGNQTFGIGAAAQTYFGTTPDRLTIAQSALLAAVVNQPGSLNPNSNPEDALKRRNLVIDLMADPHNNIRIRKEDAQLAKEEPLGVLSPLGRPPNGCVGVGDGTTDGFFCTYVTDYLERAGIDSDKLKTGGYTVRTTMDRKATDAAKAAAEKQVPTQTEGIANAMSVVEPGADRHKVRALVANRDYGNDSDQGQTAYDIVSRVQPFGAGSIYKVFTAATAIEQGMGIGDMLDVPPSYTSQVYKNNGRPYTVGNAEGVQPGSRTLQMALATSPNTAFVALQEKVGLNNVVDMATRMGLRHGMVGVNSSGQTLKPGGSNGLSQADTVKNGKRGAFTLGYTPTSVLELSNVAATIMSHGVFCPPTPIEEVRDRHGNVVPLPPERCEQAVSPQTADQLAQGMGKDDTDGTSRGAAKAANWTRPMIGKTGTTQEHKSAGFLAATPQMAGAVLTYADGSRPREICDGGGDAPPFLCGDGNIYGGKVPARTWFEAMSKIHEGLPVVGLPGTPLPPPPPPAPMPPAPLAPPGL